MWRQSCNAGYILFLVPYPFLLVTAKRSDMVIIITGPSFLFLRNIVLDIIQIIQFRETMYSMICEDQRLSYGHQEVSILPHFREKLSSTQFVEKISLINKWFILGLFRLDRIAR